MPLFVPHGPPTNPFPLPPCHADAAFAEAEARLPWEALRRLECLLERADPRPPAGLSPAAILQSALELVSAETIIWLRDDRQPRAQLCGRPMDSADQLRSLIATLGANLQPQESFYLCNEPSNEEWADRFPEIRNFLVLGVRRGGASGWLIAVNRPDGFHPRHAAALGPFARLLVQ